MNTIIVNMRHGYHFMTKFVLLSNLFKRSHIFVLNFFVFKFFLCFFYVMGSYQAFTYETTQLILRLVISNDILIIFFSMVSFFTVYSMVRKVFSRVMVLLFSFFNIILSLVTMLFAFVLLTIS